jgi:hypothetical protein
LNPGLGPGRELAIPASKRSKYYLLENEQTYISGFVEMKIFAVKPK